jgi:HK97 family phage major capsid protein
VKHFSRAQLMAGAASIPDGLEVKDGGNLDTATKEAVDLLGKTFAEFRTKNDARLEQLSKKGEDAVTKDELEKINKGLDALKDEINKQLEETLKKTNRLSLTGGGDADGAREAKAARAFGELVGKADYSIEDLREYKKDLARFIRRNEAKASVLSVGVDPAGGYMVTPDTSGRMVKKIYDSTPMRQLANIVSIGTDKLEGPIDNGEMDAQWVGEQTVRAGTDSPEFGMWSIDVHELYAYPTVTQRLLEDAKIDVEGWLGDKASSKFARKENTAFISGNGVLKPKGLMTYDFVATDDATRAWGKFQFMLSGHATLINSADALINLIFELNPAYRQAARFLLARRTQRDIRKLKDGQNNYLSGLQLADGVLTEQLLGFGTTEGEDMPAIGAGAYPVAFGDFAETYTIVDRLGISVIRDNITRPGFVKFLMRKRVGGGATNFESCKMLKVAAA